MNIESLYCPCEGKEFPPDHYTSGACLRPPMPLAAVRSIMLSDEGDDFHADGRITITRLLTCPREIVIQDNCLLQGVDLRKRDTLRKGQVIHADLQKHAAGGYAEIEFPLPGRPAPLFLGEPISGRIDFCYADFSQIEDYKSHSESGQSNKGRPFKDISNNAMQLNIGRILIAKDILYVDPPTYRPRLVTWHTAQVSAGGPPPWIPVEEPYLSEEELADCRPGSGKATIAEILEDYRLFNRLRAGGMSIDDAIKQLALVGRSMFKRQKCPSYCIAQKYCDGLEGIAQTDWSF